MTLEMTYASMCWLRYEKNCDIVCTEVGHHYLKDVFGLFIHQDGLPSRSIEIEVKSSMSDLRRDFETKAQKHKWYAEGREAPSYLYYVVPKSIVDSAKEVIRKHSSKYGLMSFDAEQFLGFDHPFSLGKSLTSQLRVQRLTNERPRPALMYQCGRRIMNEYFMQKYAITQKLTSLHGAIDFYAKELTKFERGRIDKWSPLAEPTPDSGGEK